MLRTSLTVLAMTLCAFLALGVFGCAPRSFRSSPEWGSLKQEIRGKFPRVPQMSIEELDRLLHNGSDPLLVDVRTADEYAVSHLAGAINANGEELSQLLEGLGTDRVAVLYCSVGYRSSAEVSRLIQGGVDNTFNLEGSIFEWANSGRPVYRNGEQVEEVHPYDETWGQLLDPPLRSYGDNP